ncbi:hypothetical protein GJW-30_1_00775 [Variibacter gotjawalensis]|uniref:Uncharacterized protein n=1 Tax=Variibacter gotjawalensis TaxID=1333996 RepID=A0A0S3PQU8_9BRAD|nr:hypothetical protein [Variibacter gotjawalensis]NIK48553.1 hypothetical protein [Variibacter gotjawalensis]RZS50418.1 hypothetical protein EV661_2882 [Variibacter gotjawalensis]BAT58252.1 hypothetical protein GJW-30_1_00775 [Variibacter gotjawalensis]
MSVVNEMRRGSPQTDRSGKPKSGSKAGMILLVLLALGAIGAAAYMYLNRAPDYGPTVAIAFTPDRLGKEAAAPLLNQCAKQRTITAPTQSAADTAVMLFIRDKANELADCAYEQPMGVLCDSNNRAFAVATALQMLRNTDPLVEQKGTGRSNSHAMVVRERVVASIGKRARQGELIARDFGEYPPASLQAVFTPGAASNACAK